MSVQMNVDGLLILLSKYEVTNYIGHFNDLRMIVGLSDGYEEFIPEFYFSNDKDYAKFKRGVKLLKDK